MIYRSLLRPLLFRLPPETAHELALHSLSFFLNPALIRKTVAARHHVTPFSKLKRFGLEFSNPVGLAAGFDKNGTAAQALAALGFGSIEVGSVTSEPQPGNPTPRLFRLPRDRALINRAGFNNCGASQLAEHIRRRRPECVLGVKIGKSRSVANEAARGRGLWSWWPERRAAASPLQRSYRADTSLDPRSVANHWRRRSLYCGRRLGENLRGRKLDPVVHWFYL